MISRITKVSLLVLSSAILFGCAIATKDLSGGAPKEDTAEITGSWGFYIQAGKSCEIMAVDEQEISRPLMLGRLGARTVIVRPGMHSISVRCEQHHILGDQMKQRDLKFNAKPGHNYYIEWNIISDWRCMRAIDEDSRELVDSVCGVFSL